MINRNKYKKYCNENYIRFNLDDKQIWKQFDKEFGQNRTDELSNIFKERYENPDKKINPYKFCKNFRETSVLMYFQSDFFLENSIRILEKLEEIKPRKILELGCYNGILLNYIADNHPEQSFMGIDQENQIIEFAKQRFKKNNLNYFPLEYKNLSKLNNKYDFIFTLFGIEDIPNKIKFDTYKIRNNKNYFSKYDFFNIFFQNLDPVIEEGTILLPLIRIPNLNCLLAFLDASVNNHWMLKGDKINYVESRNFNGEIERIPSFLLEYNLANKTNNKINLDLFFKITNEYRKEDELINIFNYENNKSKFNDLLKEDKIFYEDDQNTLYYKIYKKLGIYIMFLWATNGLSHYQEFQNLEKLTISFFELTNRPLKI
jgi:2-polyprenyl-3-methyl-5-hydroxy-6-metoxy-1,4-benzoquinol methylase